MGIFNPIVLLANYYQFSNREKVVQPCLKSRLLLWCKAGEGTITVNGVKREALPGTVFFLPWGIALTYQAPDKNPFLVGGVHLIPDHARRGPVIFGIAHSAQDPLSVSPLRRNTPLPGLEGPLQSRWTPETPLIRLAEYTVERFRAGMPSEIQARFMAELLVTEMRLFFRAQPQSAPGKETPPHFRQLLQFIETHAHEPLSLQSLIRFSGYSAATLCRLFKRCGSGSPVDTILGIKIEKARTLLLSSKCTVAQAGQAVGIDDPYYFSKLFKKRVGRSPRDYRNAMSLV